MKTPKQIEVAPGIPVLGHFENRENYGPLKIEKTKAWPRNTLSLEISSADIIEALNALKPGDIVTIKYDRKSVDFVKR